MDGPPGVAARNFSLARLGFGSRPAIHPAQVQTINEAFTPTAEQLADARELIGAFEEALAAGAGAAASDGVMFDAALVRARRVLDRAQKAP